MSLSLERVAEDFFVALLEAQVALAGILVVRHDQDREAVNNCLIVTATVGNNRLDGDKGFDVEVEVKYRGGPKTTSDQYDVIAAAIVKAVYEWPVTDAAAAQALAVAAGFKFLIIEPEAISNRQDTHSLRLRSHTFPLICDLP